MSDIKFADGFYFKKPRPNAPDFVLGELSVKLDDAIEFLNSQKGSWLNLVIKESKAGKPYISIDTWEPKEPPTEEEVKPEDLPF